MDVCHKKYMLPGFLSGHFNPSLSTEPPSGHQWITNIKNKSKLSHKCLKDNSLTLIVAFKI